MDITESQSFDFRKEVDRGMFGITACMCLLILI